MLNEKTQNLVKSFIAKLGIELPAKPVVKLEDVTLMDGTMLTVDAMEVGSPAMFTGADGVAIPAEGEYELADGSKIVCAAGVVTEIKPMEVEAEKKPEVPAAPSEEMAAVLSRMAEMEGLLKTLTSTNQTLETQLEENKKGLVVALSAIEEFNTTAVAVSLEASKKPATKIDFSKLSEFEKYQLAKYEQIKY